EKTSRKRRIGPSAPAGNNGDLVIQPEGPITAEPTHSDTPLFHGIKSSWASDSALVWTSPLATRTIRSRTASPISSTVLSPEMIGPASMSMMSGILCARLQFVEILITGAMGLPVGVPKPVVNNPPLAPDPTCALTPSTSLPGVQSKVRPGFLAYSGKSSTSVTGEVPPFLAAPADFIASVISPSRMLPGEGFESNPEPTASALALYARMS